MKTIIAGGRKFKDRKLILNIISDIVVTKNLTVTEVVSGGATGIDSFGKEWADIRGIPVKLFPAQWKDLSLTPCVVKTGMYSPYNALAGHNRNAEMAAYGDCLILIWDGASTGSANMKKLAMEKEMVIYEKIIK